MDAFSSKRQISLMDVFAFPPADIAALTTMLFVTYDPNDLVHVAKLSKVSLSRKPIIWERMSLESDIPKTIIGDKTSIIGAAEQIGVAGNKKRHSCLRVVRSIGGGEGWTRGHITLE